jgi:hypothetical protein
MGGIGRKRLDEENFLTTFLFSTKRENDYAVSAPAM